LTDIDAPQAERGGVMESQNIGEVEPAEGTSGIAAEDIIWAFVVSAIVLGLTPAVFIYALLVA
jgi:hypothetical protein